MHALDAVGDKGQVTVVDSDSGDDSLQRLGEVKGVHVVSQSSNLGFGASLNAGARNHTEPFLLCMNADVIITADVLNVLEQKLMELSALGIVGPRLRVPMAARSRRVEDFPHI